jgi:hypothetical protein
VKFPFNFRCIACPWCLDQRDSQTGLERDTVAVPGALRSVGKREFGSPPASNGLDWRTELARWARTSLASFQSHPWLLESIMRRAPIGPNWLDWLESALNALSSIGLNAPQMLSVVFLVDGHVRSAAQISLGVTGTEEWAANFGRVLQTVNGDTRYTSLNAVAVCRWL